MSTRLDQSPFDRLRRVARFLSVNGVQIGDDDIEEALRKSRGNASHAEEILRKAAAHCHVYTSLPTPSQKLTRSQRISKAISLLAPFPEAVDILYSSLTKVRSSPNNERLRKVNVSAKGAFKDRVASKPGGIELLYSLGYDPMHGHLVLQQFDSRLFDQALAEMKEVRETNASYLEAKALMSKLQAEAAQCARQEESANALRAAWLAKVPQEPAPGNGSASTSTCVLTFSVNGTRVAKRNFESDNTLKDVVNFIKSLTAVPVDAKHLNLENITTYPHRQLELEAQAHVSLYALDLWPISHVGVTVEA